MILPVKLDFTVTPEADHIKVVYHMPVVPDGERHDYQVLSFWSQTPVDHVEPRIYYDKDTWFAFERRRSTVGWITVPVGFTLTAGMWVGMNVKAAANTLCYVRAHVVVETV